MTTTQTREQYRFGSSRLADAYDLARARLFKGTGIFTGYFPAGMFGRLKPLFIPGDAGALLIAGAGTGKSTGLLVYNTVLSRGPLLVCDPKGELSAISIACQRRLGKEVYALNPCRLFPEWELPATTVNLVDFVLPGPDLVANAGVVTEALIPLSSAAHGYFEQAARRYVAALLMFDALDHGRADLNRLWSSLTAIQANPDTLKALLPRMMQHRQFPDVAAAGAEILTKMQNAPEEAGGTFGTIFNHLGFLADPRLQACVSSNGVALDVLCRQNCYFSVVIPADLLGQWSGLVRLIFTAGIFHKTRSPSSPGLLLLIDEAGQLGNFEAIKRAYTYGRGAGIRPLAVYQDIGQIEAAFGRAGLTTLMESAQTRIFSGIRTYDTARLVSSMIGNETLSFDPDYQQAQLRLQAWQAQDQLLNGGRMDALTMGLRSAQLADMSSIRNKQQRAVLTPDEVLQLGNNRAVIFYDAPDAPCPPIIAHKVPYWKSRLMRGKFAPNPYHL